MIYKNGIKEWVLLGCLSGLLYGFFMGLFFKNIVIGIIVGVLFGAIFAACIAIFSKKFEKKSECLRAEISQVRKIICEGPATHINGKNAIGGWMFLSEDAIEFYPHKMNVGGENMAILIDDITNVEIKINQLKICAKANKELMIYYKQHFYLFNQIQICQTLNIVI